MPCILTRRHAAAWTPAAKQKFTGFLVEQPYVVINGLSGLLCQFKTDRPAGLLLAHGGSISGIAAGRDIVAIDRQIEQRQIARLPGILEHRSYCPDVLWPERRFLGGVGFSVSCMIALLC